MRNSEWAHLHVHTEYSVLDGFGSAERYAKQAKKMGFKSLAITDHGNVDGAIIFQRACIEEGIKPIIGVEAYIVSDLSVKEKGEKRRHVCLYAMNETGWHNILKMLTVANAEGFYYRPRIDPELLLDLCEGVCVTTACCSGFLLLPEGEQLLVGLNEKTKVFLEIMPVKMDLQRDYNAMALEYHERYGIPLIATNDCHYILPEHVKLQEVLLAIQSKAKWDDPNRWKFSIDDLYMKSATRMIEDLEDIGVERATAIQALKNTQQVVDLCNFTIEQVQVELPDVAIEGEYADLHSDDQLSQLTMDGLESMADKHSYIADDIDAYYERLLEELDLIISLDFAKYFLIVWELINWCKANDIMVGPGRGSVGGCLVAYCLGITAVDPIKYDLVFTRFISPARIDLPDIDMDFEDTKRDAIRKHLEDLYGKFHVTGISTFSKLSGRSCLRDVSRVFNVPIMDVNAASKSIVVRSVGDFRSSFTISDAFETFEDGVKFKKKYPEVTKMAIEMEGQVRGCGKHAAAMCVSKHDLRSGKNINLSYRSKELMCNWAKEDAEYMGLMKLDVLGLNALTVLAECRKLIIEKHDIDIDYDLVPLDDQKTLGELTKGHTIGVFQFAGHNAVKLCKEIGIEDFDELVAVNALNRPGPLRSGMTTDYTYRKKGEQKMPKQHPIMQKILGKTQGIVIYQEQIMFIIYELAGLPWRTADVVRKVISKGKGEEQFLKFKDTFVQGCLDKGTLKKKEAEEAFESYKHAGSYMFNKSHAVEYSLIAYWQAWLKAHYPLEYMSTLLTFGSKDAQKKRIYVNEAKRLGVKINLPDINMSHSHRWVIDENNVVRIPFTEIKGVGPAAAKAITKEREKGDYVSKDQFENRVPKRACNKRVKGILDELGSWEVSDEVLTEERLEQLSVFFDFELSNDPMFRFRKIHKIINDHYEKFSTLKSVSTTKKKDADIFFGHIDLVKYGYKEKVGSKNRDDSGLGGVYATYSDGTDSSMLTFSPRLYKERKDTIEHCSDQWALAKANSPFQTDSLYCDEIWFGDDILAGNLEGLGLELAVESDYYMSDYVVIDDNKLSDCEDCVFNTECKSPVYPSKGEFNIMVIGEAPGVNEDKQGKYFLGDQGSLLFRRTLEPLGIKREYCHLTSFCKCYPKKSKSPKRTHINKCRKWIEKEIEVVKPFVILAFGNSAMKFFANEDSGIMSKSGTTEWSDKYNCWICWSITPASVLYSTENKEMFNEAMENFADKVSILGFGA